jgi:hypothetical protein
MGDGAATNEHGERHVGVIPLKEPYFLPPVRRTGRQEVEVGISSTPRSNEDVHTTQSHRFRTQFLL